MASLNREICHRSTHRCFLMAAAQCRRDAPSTLAGFLGGGQKKGTGSQGLVFFARRFINCGSRAQQWREAGLTPLSRSAKRLDNVPARPSSSVSALPQAPGRVQIFARNLYPGRTPPPRQKILTGRLYYSGIIVARSGDHRARGCSRFVFRSSGYFGVLI